MEILLITILIILLITLAFFTFKLWKKNKDMAKSYAPIMDMDKAVSEKQQELDRLKNESAEFNEKFKKAKEIYNNLQSEIKLYEDDLELMSFGIYKPEFSFDTSEEYKKRLIQLKNDQKELIKDEKAAICHTDWTVGDSKKKGEIMTRRYIKLSLRAFNGECDALIQKVKWNNVNAIEQRIEKLFDAINKLGQSNTVEITQKFLSMKLRELHLTHEYEQKRYEEKEEQRRIREQMREEEKAAREIEKAKREAEQQEKLYHKALDKARKDVANAQGAALDILNMQIQELEGKLKEAEEKMQRATSMAQLTKSGHVYVISNIGSFGDNVYKIGMTRRLEPMDRVKELGDASVPFEFDVHAMIYSDNAPELENKLHREFQEKRVNMVNNRKEFFKVSLSEIEKIVKENNDKIEFTKIAEAREFRETKEIIMELEKAFEKAEKEEKYPDNLF